MNECDQETEQRSDYRDMQVERWRESCRPVAVCLLEALLIKLSVLTSLFAIKKSVSNIFVLYEFLRQSKICFNIHFKVLVDQFLLMIA